MEVEHKLTKTENRLEMVIREILESRKYVKEIHMQQQHVNDMLLQGLRRIEGLMLLKTSSISAAGKGELVSRSSLIEESARNKAENKTISVGENEISLVLTAETATSNNVSDKSVEIPTSNL